MLCKAKRADGKPCRAQAHGDARYCTFHDPKLAEQRAEGRRQGGVSRSKPAATLPPDTPDASLGSVAEVACFIAATLNQVRTGRLAANVGNCIFVGAGVLLKAIEVSDFERRIAALEESRQQPTRPRIAALNGRPH